MYNIKEPPVKKVLHKIVYYPSTCMQHRITGRKDGYMGSYTDKTDQQLIVEWTASPKICVLKF